jgi:hypothetical protein
MDPDKWIEGILYPASVWTTLPGTDVQVLMRQEDPVGSVRYRYHPKEQHMLLCDDAHCLGCL